MKLNKMNIFARCKLDCMKKNYIMNSNNNNNNGTNNAMMLNNAKGEKNKKKTEIKEKRKYFTFLLFSHYKKRVSFPSEINYTENISSALCK